MYLNAQLVEGTGNNLLRLWAFMSLFLVLGCQTEKSDPLPAVWSSYKVVMNYDDDFGDLKAHGVGSVHARNASSEILEAARKHGMKITISLEEITERAYDIPQDKVERAIMVGGAYNGKAVDRFRFAFTPEKHTIVIESPIYDKEDCYETLGHYFPGMRPPVKVEVIVKEKDFDGQQHLQVIDGVVGDQIDEHHWNISFNLSGVEDDLSQVALAVYWISEGTRSYWMFGDSASPGAESTKNQLVVELKKLIREWKEVNGGTFPKDVITGLRFGDECFHISGHVNSDACSYPMWDFSETTQTAYQQFCRAKMPTGKMWLDMFGRDAYAAWMYNYHRLNAELVTLLKATLKEEGLAELQVFRNITRYNVFNELNDHDGSGLDVLAKEFDIVHLDPYPVNAKGYRDEVIPMDMAYCEGLARRHSKKLVPWLQAHQYWPGRGGLAHPGPDYIERMVGQHLEYSSEALMWLGYGKPPFSTFPIESPESWEEAKIQHQRFAKNRKAYIQPDFAVLRPYNVRALRNVDNPLDVDVFLTNTLIKHAVVNKKMHYDPFEPLNLAQIDIAELNEYKMIIAEAGKLNKEELTKLRQIKSKVVVLVFGADSWTNDGAVTGIKSIQKEKISKTKLAENNISVQVSDKYLLDSSAKILEKTDDGSPVIWEKDNLVFVACVSEDNALASKLLKMGSWR